MIIKAIPDVKFISDEDVEKIHRTSMRILEQIGITVYHDKILTLLQEGGAKVDRDKKTAKLSEAMVMDAAAKAKKDFILYGRDETKQAWIRPGCAVAESTSGQYSMVERSGLERRPPVMADARQAIKLADALEEIDITGAFIVPTDVPMEIKDVHLARELAHHTTKPVGLWMNDGRTADYVLKIFETAVGGADVLRAKPITQAYIEPVSPLRFSTESLDILIEFAKRNAPVCFGPVPMAMATAPTTPVGTVVIANTEILAANVMAQLLQPGMPVAYWGAQQTMDPQTANVSFASPAQGMMASIIVQVGRYYGFSVSSTVAFSDSNQPDNQSGVERSVTLLAAMLAGCNICGMIGIWGGDQGASLAQLVLDNEMLSYVRAMLRKVEVNEETMAFEAIKRVGIGGDYLSDEHTLRNYRKELWFGKVHNRDSWDVWVAKGKKSILERAAVKADELIQSHQTEPLSDDAAAAIDALVDEAQKKIPNG